MIKKIFIIVLIMISLFSFNCIVFAEDDSNVEYEINLDDSKYIESLQDEIDDMESQLSKKEKEIDKLEDQIDKYKSDIQYYWICFIFLILLSIYISYNIGLNKNK